MSSSPTPQTTTTTPQNPAGGKSPELVVDDSRPSPSREDVKQEEDQVEQPRPSSPPTTAAPTIIDIPQPLTLHQQQPHTTNNNENLIPSLPCWEWVIIDGLKLPAVTRKSERYVAVHMVQLKLLSKFEAKIPSQIVQKFTMTSHKMTNNEAWIFNSINAVLRKFDLGCQLFTARDELVKLNDVQMFYWNVKFINLERIKNEYEQTLASIDNDLQLVATIRTLKKIVENDIQLVFNELNRQEKERGLNNTSSQDDSSAKFLNF